MKYTDTASVMGELECLHKNNPSIKAAATKYENSRSSQFCLIIEVFGKSARTEERKDALVSGSLCSGQRHQLPLYRTGEVLGLHWGPQVTNT